MKKILAVFFALALVFSLCGLTVLANSQVSEASSQVIESDFESSEESQIVIQEHPNIKYTPVYAALGIFGAVFVFACAVVITKKIK